MTDYFLLVTCSEYYNQALCTVLWAPNLTAKSLSTHATTHTCRHTTYLLATFWDLQMHTPMTRYALWRMCPGKKLWGPGRWALAPFGREFHCPIPWAWLEDGRVYRTSHSWAHGPVDRSLWGEGTGWRRMQTGAFKRWRLNPKVGTTSG